MKHARGHHVHTTNKPFPQLPRQHVCSSRDATPGLRSLLGAHPSQGRTPEMLWPEEFISNRQLFTSTILYRTPILGINRFLANTPSFTAQSYPSDHRSPLKSSHWVETSKSLRMVCTFLFFSPITRICSAAVCPHRAVKDPLSCQACQSQ